MMEKDIKKIEEGTYEITLQTSGEEWNKEIESAYNKLAKNVEIKGFRKGKAPKDMVRSRIKPEKMFNEAINSFLEKNFDKVIKEAGLALFDQPHLHVEKISNEELTLKIHAVVEPTVELGNYKNIEIDKEVVVVVDEDIDARIKDLQEKNAELTVKEEGTVEDGNTVIIDFEGFLGDKPFEGGKASKYQLEIGSNSFIPGFEEQIIGMKSGEDKDIKVTFPENYTPELKGKEATFKIHLHEIKVKELPSIDDELALDANLDDVSTLEELKEHYRKELFAEKEAENNNKSLEKLLDVIVKGSKVEVSKSLIDREVSSRIEGLKADLERQGTTYEGYLEQIKTKEEDFVNNTREQTKNNINFAFVIMEIAKQEKIEVSEEEIDKDLEEIAKMYGQSVENIKNMLQDRLHGLRQDKLFRKVYDFLKTVNNL